MLFFFCFFFAGSLHFDYYLRQAVLHHEPNGDRKHKNPYVRRLYTHTTHVQRKKRGKVIILITLLEASSPFPRRPQHRYTAARNSLWIPFSSRNVFAFYESSNVQDGDDDDGSSGGTKENCVIYESTMKNFIRLNWVDECGSNTTSGVQNTMLNSWIYISFFWFNIFILFQKIVICFKYCFWILKKTEQWFKYFTLICFGKKNWKKNEEETSGKINLLLKKRAIFCSRDTLDFDWVFCQTWVRTKRTVSVLFIQSNFINLTIRELL